MSNYNYQVITVDLTVAHRETEFHVGLSNCVLVRSIDDVMAGLSIKFDHSNNPNIVLVQGDLALFHKFGTLEPIYFEKILITNVAVAQGSAVLMVTQNIEFARRLRFTSDIVSTGLLQQVLTIQNVATLIPVNPIVGRINILLQNNGANTIYIGSATVTDAGVTQGIHLAVGASMSFTISAGVPLYGIVAAATEPLNILEGA